MIIADTSAVLALIDRSDRHHELLRGLYDDDPAAWILPWSILPEVDYLLATRMGEQVEMMFVTDLAEGAWSIEWGVRNDLVRARQLLDRYAALSLGLVDATVIAVAERLRAGAIATLDLRDFAAVEIAGRPALFPRDL